MLPQLFEYFSCKGPRSATVDTSTCYLHLTVENVGNHSKTTSKLDLSNKHLLLAFIALLSR
jgi:hypothetical protein